jgi:hypothetical protein
MFYITVLTRFDLIALTFQFSGMDVLENDDMYRGLGHLPGSRRELCRVRQWAGLQTGLSFARVPRTT